MEKPGTCGKRVRLHIASWNLGGQPLEKVNNACPEGDILLVQEAARRDPGWKTDDDERCVRTSFQHPKQWRGTAIGIATDLFDCIVDRRTCDRGCAVIARLKNLGRIILASFHAPTGVTSDVYGAALHEVGKMFDNKWRHLPCIVAIDANEEARWSDAPGASNGTQLGMGNTNFQIMTETMLHSGLHPIPPCLQNRNDPTHFARDAERQGRQIDMFFVRHVHLEPFIIDADRRIAVGSDHALLLGQAVFQARRKQPWGADSRPRWVVAPTLPEEPIVDWEDIEKLAMKFTRPRLSQKYRDEETVRDAFRKAKSTMDKSDWKAAHRLRRAARADWCKMRRERVLRGDWLAYREHKKDKQRKPGWWGRLLEDRNAKEITEEVQSHLEDKLRGPPQPAWDDFIETTLVGLPDDLGWVPFTWEEVNATLSEMRANTSVGPDGIGVDLLRHLLHHERLGGELVALINDTVINTLAPSRWDTSLLALLAKVETPLRPKDLRPISMSSAAQKCINKLTMARVFPLLRRPSGASCCGRGRQAADAIGCFTRLRDNTREWKLPVVCAKLDVRGAFDKVRRSAAVDLLVGRTRNHKLNAEVRWLVRQLATNSLEGTVPGGEKIRVECTQGIKQGAPESAELFGLLMGCQIDELLDTENWRSLPVPWGDVPLSLIFYQDDIFVWDEHIAYLEKKIALISEALLALGLELAEDKTQVIASQYYKGPRTLQIGGERVDILPAKEQIRVVGVNFSFYDGTGQQAKDLLARARAAAHCHQDLLMEQGPWDDKARLLQTLVFGTLSWCAGAVHWNQEDLAMANSLQCTTLRKAFNMKRKPGETWVVWNQRTCRHVRAWLHSQQKKRWSSLILELQFGLYGHWGRQSEGSDVHGERLPGNPMRMLRWRSQSGGVISNASLAQRG